jgi:hypothetical protein
VKSPDELMLGDLREHYEAREISDDYLRLYLSEDPNSRMFAYFQMSLNGHFEFMNQKAKSIGISMRITVAVSLFSSTRLRTRISSCRESDRTSPSGMIIGASSMSAAGVSSIAEAARYPRISIVSTSSGTRLSSRRTTAKCGFPSSELLRR